MGSGVTREHRIVVTGTGAELAVECGFRPRHVHLINLDSADEATWGDGMDDDSMLKRVAAGAATVESSDGITPSATGFTLGADTDINVDGERLLVFCVE